MQENNMTLNEAIEHLDESLSDPKHFSCEDCRNEHIQLRNWLIDYRRLLQKESQDELMKLDVRMAEENLSIKSLSELYDAALINDEYMGLYMTFDGSMLDYLRQVFMINNTKDLYVAVQFMIKQYMLNKERKGEQNAD